ncbi:Flp family type IVb pilin [Devosia sp. A449]
MIKLVLRFVRDEAGITWVEHGLIAAIVTVAMTIAASAAGFSLADLIGG